MVSKNLLKSKKNLWFKLNIFCKNCITITIHIMLIIKFLLKCSGLAQITMEFQSRH